MGAGRRLWLIAVPFLVACQLGGTQGEPCLVEADCIAALECVYGICRAECGSDECLEAFTDDFGFADPPPCFRYEPVAPNPREGELLSICLLPSESPCESDFDCAPSHFCRDAYCHPECETDVDCLRDQRCVPREEGLRLCEETRNLGAAPGSCGYASCVSYQCDDPSAMCVQQSFDYYDGDYLNHVLLRFTSEGLCLPRPVARVGDPSACDVDPHAAVSGCGDCGVCLPTDRGDVACRARCTGVRAGCGNDDLTCDPVVSACVDACNEDTDCRTIWDSGLLHFDLDSTARCSNGLCEESALDDGAATGAPCATSEECSEGALCVGERLDRVFQHAQYCPALGGCDRWTDGYCSRLACDRGDVTCPSGAVCAQPPGAHTTMCLAQCTVGVEPEADRMGRDGHGASCRPGYACMWDGFTLDEPRGGCAIGNYNDVALDVGAACGRDSECGSPFGLGACEGAKGARSGACTIRRCDSPGLPADVCGDDARCIDVSLGERACARTCETTADCDGLQICRDVTDRDGETARACVSRCERDEECPAGARCASEGGEARCEPR